MDGALWHQSSLNQNNVTLLKLLPYSPELNPTEQMWQIIKQNWLSNRCYASYESIVDASCYAWNRLCEQPENLKSLTYRNWIKLF